jgi:hypothetical protein
MYKFLNTLHPGGIWTQELLFCRRTRWPQSHATRANIYLYSATNAYNTVTPELDLGGEVPKNDLVQEWGPTARLSSGSI